MWFRCLLENSCKMPFLDLQVPVCLILMYPICGFGGCVQAISGTGVDMAICTPGRLQVQRKDQDKNRLVELIELIENEQNACERMIKTRDKAERYVSRLSEAR